VGNLADLIVLAASHPKAAGEIFLVSDGEDISTTELFKMMAQALGRPSLIMPIPSQLVTLVAAAIGQRAVASRLTDSLQVDITKTRAPLGWEPRKCVSVCGKPHVPFKSLSSILTGKSDRHRRR
jgi:nucleoside-diphosphate-sugar epimerase